MKNSDVKIVDAAQLKLAAENTRKAAVAESDRQALQGSIAQFGVLVPLIGYLSGKQFAVVDGGRRSAALAALLAEGRLDATTRQVPVRVIARAQATDASLIANLVRAPMRAVDVAHAVARLRVQGSADADIAAALGQKLEIVRAWGRYPTLPDEVRALVDAGDLGFMAALRLVTVAADRAVGIARSVVGSWAQDEAAQIGQVRRLIAAAGIGLRDRRVQFVGREAYEAEGGGVQETLLDPEDAVLLDGDLLDQLVAEKLTQTGLPSGVTLGRIDADAQEVWDLALPKDCVRLKPVWQIPETCQAGAAPLEAEIREIDEKITAFEETDREEDASDCDAPEIEALLDRRGDLVDQLEALESPVYAPEECDGAEAISWVDRKGVAQVTLYRPLVAPEPKPDETSEEKPLYSAKLQEDMARLRRVIRKGHLADRPERAFTLMAFCLALHLAPRPVPGEDLPLSVMFSDADGAASPGDDLAHSAPMLAWRARAEKLDWGWMIADGPGRIDLAASLVAFEALPVETQRHLFAFGVAARMQNGDAKLDGLLAGEIDYPAAWRPDEGYFKRVRKAVLVEKITALARSETGRMVARFKKGDLDAWATRLFAGEKLPGIAAAVSARAARWMPDGVCDLPIEALAEQSETEGGTQSREAEPGGAGADGAGAPGKNQSRPMTSPGGAKLPNRAENRVRRKLSACRRTPSGHRWGEACRSR